MVRRLEIEPYPFSSLGGPMSIGGSLVKKEIPLLTNSQAVLATTTISVIVPAGNVLEILWGDGTASTVTCNGAVQTLTHDYAATGTYTIGVRGNWKAITQWESFGQAFLSGDISRFAPLTSIKGLYIFSTSVTGDIASLAGMTSMFNLQLYSTGVTGDIASLAGMTSMQYLFLSSTGVSGDIASLAGMTLLRYLYLYSTGVSGDIASLAGMTLLRYLYLYSTNVTYTAGAALPAWAGCWIYIYDTGLTNVAPTWMVDNFLIDFAATAGTGGKLYMAGTNGTRTAASNDAKAALLAKVPAWDLDVNE